MTTAMILHRVEDFDAWKPAYDDFDGTRREMGVTHEEVLRSEDDPQLVIVRHDFESRAAADEFFGSEELRQAMHEAGVDGASVQIHMTEPV